MIKIERGAKPAVLDRTFTRGRNKGKTEAQVVEAAFEAHLAAGEPPEKFTFDFSRYKEDEVKAALDTAFAGKCAYCETFYSASQPMDVEHWRPKGEVHLEDGTVLKPGYYWLASDWENLFPSCIDCNRARQQHDLLEQRQILLGKANQFPLLDEATRVSRHDATTEVGGEAVMLVDPSAEDPERLFAYRDNGAVVPHEGLAAADRARALASIRVYALNRSGLVGERLEVIRRVDHRLQLIDTLADLRTRLENEGRDELAEIVAELIQTETRALEEMTEATSPFAGVARFLLAAAGG